MSAKKQDKPFLMHLIAGGGAGVVESTICHPLDTIKTRMQLSRTGMGQRKGIFGVATSAIKKEGPFALYKGLTAVVCGIAPKMAIRFSSFETFKKHLADENGKCNISRTLLAGTLAGTTEAVIVVTPMEVLKIRMQAQRHSLSDPLDKPKYRGVFHAAYLITKEEGLGALYKGVIPTVLRQATNQAVNFTVYHELKKLWLSYMDKRELASYESLFLGGFSGAMGPCANSPIDVIKTRLQKQKIVAGQKPKYDGVVGTITTIYKEEGLRAFYRGLTPRLMRIAPGQAITFMVYERIVRFMNHNGLFNSNTVEANDQKSINEPVKATVA
eukprot:Nk52_evm4s745 gene=Nk52_evmTU4s745